MPEALNQVPFIARLLALLVVLGLLAALDAWRSPEPRRAGEYGFLLACGALAGAFGAGVDVGTVRLSPDYFVLGKGLEAGPSLTWRGPWLGFQAGFPAGLIAGGLLLLVNQPRPQRPPLPYRQLARAPGWLLGCALLLIPAGAAIGRWLDPLDLTTQTRGLLDGPELVAFRTVWGIHAGVYAGALLGLGLALWRVHRSRLRAAPLMPPEAGVSRPKEPR